MSILSVDLGTSNTVAVLAAHGRLRVVEVDGSPVLPSAVFAADDGRLVVGREAERRARLDPARFEPNPKRRVDEGTLLLGDRVVPVSEAFAAVLGKVADEVSRQLGGARPDEVRLTHPAQWGPVRRNVLLSAARQVGLTVQLVPEPVAAAAHFASFPGRSLAPGQALAVYDLGAGTFDVAVVSGSVVLAESGLPDLGGLDVDQALLAYVGQQVSGRDPGGWQRLLMPTSTVDRRAQRVLREDVRAAKESLSSHPQTEVPLPAPFGDVLVTRAELEALIRPNLLRSVELLDATVRSAGLTRDRLAGVYLVGGSSRIPLVATLIAEQLLIVPTNLDQPETAVALGALHVSPEGISLRTGTLPDVPALAEERTTSIAPPPRPVAAMAPASAPPPRAWAPVPQLMPPAGALPPAHVGASPAKRKRGLIVVPVVLAVILVVWFGVTWIVKLAYSDEGNSGPTVNTAVDIPDTVDCETVIPLDDVHSLTNNEAEVTNGEQPDPQSSFVDLCRWYESRSGAGYFVVYLQKGPWLPTNSYRGSQGKEFMIKNNSAYKAKVGSSCEVAVAVGPDTVLEVKVHYDNDDPCVGAQTLLEIAFDNIRDA